MKKTLTLLAFALGFLQTNAQTYVSGGIYANTTWTKAASPYILTDTVVVFPGVKLTINPGVTVKFVDTSIIEIRESIINAEGLSTDPIVFTSNSTVLKASNWGGIIFNKTTSADTIKFSFCDFKYAEASLDLRHFSKSTLMVKNCKFIENYYGVKSTGNCFFDSSEFRNMAGSGIYGTFGNNNFNHCSFVKNKIGIDGNLSGYVKNSLIDSNTTGITNLRNGLVDNSDITNNNNGIDNESDGIKIKNCRIKYNTVYGINSMYGDTIYNNEISGNNTGLIVRFSYVSKNRITNNKVGISIINDPFDTKRMIVVCNKICTNTDYDLITEKNIKTNLSFPNNFWCTPDSASTRPRILDGYKDPTLPLVNFMPLDASSCYSITGTGIIETKSINTQTKLYPNPFSQTATLAFENPQNNNHQLSVFNTMGQLVMSIENIKGNKILIDRKELQSGLYFYQLRNEERVIGSGKMMIE